TVVTYTITATAGPNGSIDPAGTITVSEGGEQTFNIIPDAGYSVDNVIVDGISKGKLQTVTFTNVTADHSIEAFFVKDANPITVTGVTTDCNAKGKARNVISINVSAAHNQVTTNRGTVINDGGGKYRIREIGIPFGSNITYNISAKNAGTTIGSISEVVNTVSSCPKSAAELGHSTKANMSITPNPVSNLARVELTGFDNAFIQIININGQNMYEEQQVNEYLEINTSELQPGIYFIRAIDNNNIVQKQIVIK
ncbi:MAG: T9SS type A sorting domain-containing protein, partial [Bacteroidales bacterium]|nr:T9SS type A sorting domain-containing protein [Bacteroidales bacterium]